MLMLVSWYSHLICFPLLFMQERIGACDLYFGMTSVNQVDRYNLCSTAEIGSIVFRGVCLSVCLCVCL